MLLKNLLAGQQWRNIENRLMDMGKGEERMSGMERVTCKHITICKTEKETQIYRTVI